MNGLKPALQTSAQPNSNPVKFLRLSLAALLFVAPSCSAAPVALAPALPVPAPVGTDFDLQKFVDGAVQAGQKKIVVPPGRYRVTPHDRQHLVLANLHDIEIVADGVEMICTQTTRAVSIANCSNLTLRGLSVDYDPLPYTQGAHHGDFARSFDARCRTLRRLSRRATDDQIKIRTVQGEHAHLARGRALRQSHRSRGRAPFSHFQQSGGRRSGRRSGRHQHRLRARWTGAARVLYQRRPQHHAGKHQFVGLQQLRFLRIAVRRHDLPQLPH